MFLIFGTIFHAVTLSHACGDYFYIRDVAAILHGNGGKKPPQYCARGSRGQ